MKHTHRMARIAAVVLTFVLTAALTCSAAADQEVHTEGFFKYVIENNTIRITEYYGRETEVEIPDNIAGMDVTVVSAGTFDGNTSVTTLTIPETVQTVEDGALTGATGLKEVVCLSEAVSRAVQAQVDTGRVTFTEDYSGGVTDVTETPSSTAAAGTTGTASGTGGSSGTGTGSQTGSGSSQTTGSTESTGTSGAGTASSSTASAGTTGRTSAAGTGKVPAVEADSGNEISEPMLIDDTGTESPAPTETGAFAVEITHQGYPRVALIITGGLLVLVLVIGLILRKRKH